MHTLFVQLLVSCLNQVQEKSAVGHDNLRNCEITKLRNNHIAKRFRKLQEGPVSLLFADAIVLFRNFDYFAIYNKPTKSSLLCKVEFGK